MKTKNKLTHISCEHSLIVTPLSVEACLTEISAMAHFDLEVNIIRQSKYNAEVRFVERHNDDLPIYINSRLMATPDGTCVTFGDDKSQQIEWSLVTYFMVLVIGAIAIYALGIVLYLIMMIIQNPETLPTFLVIAPFAYVLGTLKSGRYNISQSYRYDSRKMENIFSQRTEALKANLYDTLTVDPSEAHSDELGNIYYVDTVNHTSENRQ